MKIALFGGSFDPIHNGHLALARGVAKRLGIERVVLMPTGVPPHKIKKTQTAAKDRLAMCRLAVEGDALFAVSDYEITRGGASFTADTLSALCAETPQDEWYLLTGADMFLTLATWKDFARIVQLAVLCTVPRDGVQAAALQAYAAELEMRGARCAVCDLPPLSISSTEIRTAVREGREIDALVPPSVAAYIRQHHLYAEPEETAAQNEQFKAILKERLKPARYVHSLAVADEARRLALRYGADADKAYTAGLLHDIMKNTKPDAQLQILHDFGILLDDVEQRSPKLWHARTGAAFIERVLGVEDEEILTAVRYHTTARAGMSLMEQILYLADFTSADRDYDDVDVMRRLVDESIQSAMIYALRYTVLDLAQNSRPIHTDTIQAYNEWTAERGAD